MKVSGIDEAPIGRIPFLNVNGRRQIVRESLPIVLGTVAGLPNGVAGLVAMADLQGRERGIGKPGRLLGQVVAEHLAELSAAGKLPPLDRVGVLLAGDFFAEPELDRRGGLGDVREVWEAFGARFRWVAGVLGNHDTLDSPVRAAWQRPANTHLLDGGVADLDGLRIGGISGIIGKPTKANRKTEHAFLRMLDEVFLQEPRIVITHEGPACADFSGNGTLRDAFENWSSTCADSGIAPPLLLCGHRHWPQPLAELSHGMQVLNVDSRVVILLRE